MRPGGRRRRGVACARVRGQHNSTYSSTNPYVSHLPPLSFLLTHSPSPFLEMKILEAYFRENQALFFGKRGCTLLGAMILVNRAGVKQVEKDVISLYMLTDDTGHGAEQLMAAKAYIYIELLPEVMPQVK